MDINVRPLKVIKEDLGELNKLIRENKDLLNQYSEDFALKIGLRDLLYRQDQIFYELKQAKKLKMQETFDIVLEESNTPDSELSLSFFGNFVNTYQDVVTAITNREQRGEVSKGPISNEVKNLARLNLVATSVGSFRLIVTGNPGIVEPVAIPALRRFNELIDCGDDKEKIKEIRKKVGARVMKKYKDLTHILKLYGANVAFYDKFGEGYFTTISVSNELASKIYLVLEEVEKLPEKIEEYTGKLWGIDLNDKSFHFETTDGVHFRGKYNVEIEDLLRKPDLDTEINAKVKHNITYKPQEDIEVDKWELIGLRPISEKK